jgi:hypothetical protein
MAGSSFDGILWVKFALMDETGMLISDTKEGLGEDGVLLVDGEAEGATTANITGLEEKGTAQYANNKVKRMSHGTQTPSVALTMLDMDFRASQKMKGYVSDGKGGYVLHSGTKPHVAILIASTDFDGNAVYDAFANGEMIETARNHGTNTNSEVDYNATYEYDALDPLRDKIFVDDKGVQRPYKQYYSSDEGFDEAAMYEEVFGGYKYADAAPVVDNGAGTSHGADSASTN